MAKWSSEFTVPADDRDGVCGVKFEDGGQAAIMYHPVEHEPKQEGGDECFFVRLHSWDETPVGKGWEYEHRTFRQFMGKKVRVTIEVVEDGAE